MSKAGGFSPTSPSRPASSPTALKRYPSTHAIPTVHTASNANDLRVALANLNTRHTDITSQLDSVLASQNGFSRQVARVDLSRARLTKLSHSARALSQGNLASASQTASRISAAVERLDLEQSRVKATLAVVEQVAELKACVLGVVGSMGAPQDWETAAEYLSRASKIPPEVVNSGFAEQVVPTAEVPDPPAATLDHAARSLCQLFLREFEKAVEEGDGARITRFFKMFPLIGRSKEGLAAYGKYVCTGVASRARQNMHGAGRATDGYFYATALTRLFEHIAQVVDGHSNLVERHYGRGTMVKVMERLHAEADVQGGIILDTWSDERTIDRKLTEVKSYAFTFLVQSFLNVPNRSGTPRSASPAPGRKVAEQKEEGIEMKEVDSILNDITAMLGHWSLYQRFVSSRAAEAEHDNTDNAEEPPLQMPPFLAESNLPKKVTKHLIEPFGTFTTFFLRRSVEKAFQLDESPSGLTLHPNKPISANPPFITSAVDDVMYMVSQVIQRSLATSQGNLMTGILATVGRVLGSDFIGMIQRKMRDESYPKAAIQGAMPPEHKIIEFLVLINNLDIATEYIRRIVHQQLDVQPSANGNDAAGGARTLVELFPMGRESHAVRQSLVNLENGFAGKATELVNDGLAVAFSQVMKPRLRPLLNEIFREADYTTSDTSNGHRNGNGNGYDEEDEDEMTRADIVKTRFERGWSGIVRPMKQILSERNAERLMVTAIAYLSNLLEKRIWSYQGRVSEAGTLKLEQNVSDIANGALKGEHFKLREQFSRCFQIVTIMTMEEEEWDEVKINEGGDGWVLNEDERERARSMIMS
ncbi:hypothetical protein FH972_023119 [Carpinus fangiana]|uniref:Conserved oligomeric Golgi complex subunit 4 n=1 Tax=Carpinus fangiana TaxID=176857 RepID=A0A5N6KUN9_9ROSI|nr:hypothetical protein FH972_023119 [Carpinus fangiana]